MMLFMYLVLPAVVFVVCWIKSGARGGERSYQTNRVQTQTEKLLTAPLPPPRPVKRYNIGARRIW